MRGFTAMLGSYFKVRKVLLGTIVGLFIPAVYCFLYLNAIWDPYGKIDRVPAVIINQDQGAQLDGEPLQLGKELTDRLLQDNQLGWQVGTNEEAALDRLKSGAVNVVIAIPEQFSAGVAGIVQDSTPAPASPIRYYVNQGESLIVSQIGDRMTEALKAELNDKVSEKVTGKLLGAIGDGQSGLLTAADGAAQLADGSAQLQQGAAALAGSLQEAHQGAAKLADGAAKDEGGSNNLSAALEQLSGGSEQAAAQLQQGAQGVQQVGGKLAELTRQPGLPEPTKAALEQLAGQTKQLGASFTQAAQGVGSLATGGRQAAQQSQQLAAGVKQLQQGLAALTDGLAKGADGSHELTANMAKLQGGAAELQRKLQDAGNTPNTLQGKETLLNAPIAIDKSYVNPVPNNGTFFTGFFAPLSLWVGAIVFCYLTTMVKWQGWARRSLLPRYMLLALLGAMQALVLDVLLVKGLGLQVDDMAAFVLLTVLTSLAFISLSHFIFAMTGVAGNLIVLILLVFQLGLSGGSYPVSMLSDINRQLSNWMPLTYAVHGFRIAISGGSSGLLREQTSHVLIFLGVGLGLHAGYGIASYVASWVRKRRRLACAGQAAA